MTHTHSPDCRTTSRNQRSIVISLIVFTAIINKQGIELCNDNIIYIYIIYIYTHTHTQNYTLTTLCTTVALTVKLTEAGHVNASA